MPFLSCQPTACRVDSVTIDITLRIETTSTNQNKNPSLQVLPYSAVTSTVFKSPDGRPLFRGYDCEVEVTREYLNEEDL